MSLISISEASRILKVSALTIRKTIGVNNIILSENKAHEHITESDLEKLKQEFPIYIKCKNCLKEFKKKRANQKYCCSKCRVKHNKNNFIMNITESEVIEKGDFKGQSRSYATRKGMEDAKKILTCSVDCLLEELGDIE